jgi:HSP20 family protein
MLPVKSTLLPTVSNFFDDDWNNLFDWSNRNFSTFHSTLPSVNIQELPDKFIVEMAAPGMKKDDFQVEFNNGILTIKSELKNEDEKSDANYTRKEFSYQTFQRSFNLNSKIIDDSKIQAKYQNGLLLLSLPKKEEAKEKPARLIKIS